MNNNNPFESLKFPELRKNKIECIDKDKIPQEKAQWTKEDTVELSRSFLKGLTTPCLIEEGDNKDYTEWVSKLTDDEAIEIAGKVGECLHEIIQGKKEEIAFSMRAEAELHEENGEIVANPTKVVSFSPVDMDAKLLPPIIKERLCRELGIGEMPDDLETQVHMCKTWLKTKDFFQLPVEEMYDWQVILLTTSALTCPDDAAEKYHNLITGKDVEEASKDYETTLNNFNTVFGKPE